MRNKNKAAAKAYKMQLTAALFCAILSIKFKTAVKWRKYKFTAAQEAKNDRKKTRN